ncbi:MAG: ABC transporter permease [Bacillota bacterium]
MAAHIFLFVRLPRYPFNFIISILERRRSFAILRSVGMSRKQTLGMLVVEAMTGGLVAGLVGVVGGLLSISAIPLILRDMGLRGDMLYDIIIFVFAVFAGIFVSVVAALSPAIKISKMNVITALKYE